MIFAEAVTLAHVGRPIALSRVLRSLGHEVCICAAPAADRWLAGEQVVRKRIESISPATFLAALDRGVPAYDEVTLKRYVEDDRRAITAWRPDVIVGDFRLSLYISARTTETPYGAIANAYWSRRYWTGVDAPPIAALRWLPRTVADKVFRFAYPAAFAAHALPFHRTCRLFGIPPPGLDIRDIYTASDVTGFADVDGFYEPNAEAHSMTFIGPLAWEPMSADVIPPLAADGPVVFISVGSSGNTGLWERLLDAIERLPVQCVVATGSRGTSRRPRNCFYQSAFVPYARASAIAALVVCNGGAPSTYAALKEGTPVVAIPANLDQMLNMRVVRRHAAGLNLVPGPVDAQSIVAVIESAMTDPALLDAARRAAQVIAKFDEGRRCVERWLDRLFAIRG
jgi:UDP:flavonoid glycosyltransferase YjiC (YdhE family)